MKVTAILLFFFLGVCLAQEEEKCPTTDIKPCTCKTYFNGACIITCSLATDEDVDRIANIPDLCSGNVHFVLVHSNLEKGIPSKLWKKLLASSTVDVTIKHSSVQALVRPGDEDISRVYTPGSAVIKIDHSKVKTWNWNPFSQFYSEEELTIVVDDTPLTEIGSDFSDIANGQVHKITIDNAGLTTIRDKQFANFDDLNSLSLQNNKLTSVSRSMIAKPANKLQFLHLNGNSLTTLPADLFTEMPVLEVVYLRDNQFKSLPQELFQSVSSTKLQRIDLIRNPWECDCRLMGILKSTKYHLNMGNCASPESLAGKKINRLGNQLEC